MEAKIEVAVGRESAAGFIRGLRHNLNRPDVDSVLNWTRDSSGDFHTRIHYGQVSVALKTSEQSGRRAFVCLTIRAMTSPLEPENADLLSTKITREELDEETTRVADDLVEQLEQFGPHDHDLTRILETFSSDNRS